MYGLYGPYAWMQYVSECNMNDNQWANKRKRERSKSKSIKKGRQLQRQ